MEIKSEPEELRKKRVRRGDIPGRARPRTIPSRPGTIPSGPGDIPHTSQNVTEKKIFSFIALKTSFSDNINT